MGQIVLYKNNSEDYALTKSTTAQLTLDGCVFKEDSSVENPNIVISTGTDITECNYMYIADLHRYYFIREIGVVRAGVYYIRGHVDVLSTYASEIKACNAIISRQENLFNMYLDDPEFKTLNKSQVVTKKFSNGAFSKNMHYILVVAGG